MQMQQVHAQPKCVGDPPSVVVDVSASSSSRSLIRPHLSFPLYDDLLGCVLSFLSFRQLHVAAQLSRQWYKSLTSIPPLGLEFPSSYLARPLFPVSLPSALSRHVTVLNRQVQPLEYTQERMTQLAIAAPHLERIALRLNFTADPSHVDPTPSSHITPPTLSSLHTLDLSLHCAAWASMSPFTRVLNGHGSGNSEDLSITASLPRSFVEFIRQTSCSTLTLTSTGPGELFGTLFRQLVAAEPPCPLMLQAANLTFLTLRRATLNRDLLHSIAKFPALASLDVFEVVVDLALEDVQVQGSFLQLPALTELQLVEWRYERSKRDSFAMVSRCCPQLRTLSLQSSVLDEAQLDDCLSHLPNLTSLELLNCSKIKSISPLVKYNLPKRLVALSLLHCSIPKSDIIDYIPPLQILSKLLVSGDHLRDALRSVSSALPLLKRRNEDNDDGAAAEY